MKPSDSESRLEQDILEMTANIVSSFVANNAVDPAKLPELIHSVHRAIADLAQPTNVSARRPQPAVPISKSVTDEFLICLEDGKKLKMLKRYLRSRFNMTPEDYRERWGLPADYPMVAPAYAKQRSEFAKEIGLGRAKKSSE